MSETVIKFDNVKKEYRLGQIGGGTLKGDLQSWAARIRGKEDPNSLIGSNQVEVGKRFLALDGISFEVKKGEALGIIGHNGAGKSTLLKLLSRVTAPSSGTISYNGRIASMLEVGTGFHPEMTGRENIYMNGAILGMTKAEIDAKMEDIIEFSEVRQFIDTPVKRYSSGMYVKLAFSVAAHLDSEIMIMDEVLAVGDMAFQKKCLDKMRQAANEEGRTVLYVSHNMNTIRQLCNRCIVLDKGKIIFDGGVEEAIEIYIGVCGASEALIDFKDAKRRNDAKREVEIKSVEIMGKNNWTIFAGEKLKFNITVEAHQQLHNVGYRSRIITGEGASVSVFLAPNLFSCNEGDIITIPLEADTSQLVPGIYRLTPVLYGVNEFGGWQFYDHIDNGISLQVEQSENFNENMEWDRRYWGYIKLPEIVDLRDGK